ncbi:MAG: transglutaminase family protein [Actinomycetia bacterium]|nr:transglutaminase family protein [Actinomycetes bacterium]MCP4223305.1 transglutaminase family protein [Actinomycetes bacterium]MCP5032003.1 transglutaminase family protein [Actinomycetes bacterium]
MSDAAPTGEQDASRWLQPTEFLDFEQPAVRAFAESTVGDAASDVERAVRLFYAVRDGWWYDPYMSDRDRTSFRASAIVSHERSWCVPKSVLLAASARSVGVPARLGFADVRNHLQSVKLSERMRTDLFIFHGYTEFLLGGIWLKASAAFNLKLCERFETKPLEFDGTGDALLHEFDQSGNRHMEYVNQRGSFDDLPYDELMAAFDEFYGSDSFRGNADGAAGGDTAFEPPAD